MSRSATLGILLFVVLLSGCASVTGTRNQPVSVRSTCGLTQVAGASCQLNNDKGEWHVSATPGSVTVQKAFGDLAVQCEKSGLGKGVAIYKSSANASVYGNILVGGLIGFAIDSGSGSGFDYPQLMSVEICGGQTRLDLNPPLEQKASMQSGAPATPATQAPQATPDTRAPRRHRPAACDWEVVTQGVGAC